MNKTTAETDSVVLRIGIEILLMTGCEKVRWTGENWPHDGMGVI